MSHIEAEARVVLLRRRSLLSATRSDVPADPSARWTDYESSPAVAVAEGVRRELADIDAALRRIAEGRYGTCVACGGPLGLQRIRAIPEARYCVACSGQEHEVE